MSKRTAIIGTIAAGAIATGIATASPASAENFITCPSGWSGVATADTSCAFADNVARAWYSQPGYTVQAYSPVTGLVYTMTCDPDYETTYWPSAKRCVGVNGYGVGLVVYVD